MYHDGYSGHVSMLLLYYIMFILFLSDKVEVICVSDDETGDSDVVVTVIGKYIKLSVQYNFLF